MAVSVKSVGCGCPECGPDPCTSAAHVITSGTSFCATPGITFFSYTITATNSPTSFGAASLPAGLSINTATGVISGTPTATTSVYFDVYAYGGCTTGHASVYLQLDAQISYLTNCGSLLPPLLGPVDCADDSYDVTGKFTCAQYVTIESAGSGIDWQITVYANGSLLYDTTCIGFNPSPIVSTVLVPAGTTTLRAVITCGCGGGDTPLMCYYIYR